jgi:hypothetical protein
MKKQKAKMGRPPKAKTKKQAHCVMVRFTQAERRQLKQDAEAAGMENATYLRYLWLKGREA